MEGETMTTTPSREERRQEWGKLRRQLIRQLGSKSNDVVLNAVNEMRKHHMLILPSIDLHGANLSGANLSCAYLNHANLSFADLRDADLSRASLFSVDLHGADLSGACLSSGGLALVDLREADLTDADLREAGLYSAGLMGADLTDANLEGVKLKYAFYDNATIWPEGFDPKAAGATNVDEEKAEPGS